VAKPLCFTNTPPCALNALAAVRAAPAAIRAFLKLSPAWFRRRYLVRVDADTTGIRLERNGRCPFLGADNRCRIYAVRPRQCRTYPWWPELVEKKRDWTEEAQRCEGMNHGTVVPLSTIERSLARERKK
jgi:uncharacterized protein